MRSKKAEGLNGVSATITLHPKQGHPCFISKDFPEAPLLAFCVRIDSTVGSKTKSHVLEPKFLLTQEQFWSETASTMASLSVFDAKSDGRAEDAANAFEEPKKEGKVEGESNEAKTDDDSKKESKPEEAREEETKTRDEFQDDGTATEDSKSEVKPNESTIDESKPPDDFKQAGQTVEDSEQSGKPKPLIWKKTRPPSTKQIVWLVHFGFWRIAGAFNTSSEGLGLERCPLLSLYSF
jgi:hypothetical protein